VISGVDPHNGGPFVNQLILGVAGGSGAPHADGWLSVHGIGAAGFLLRDSVEIDEMKYPIRVWEQRLVPDSEGAGRFRSSPAALVEYGPVGCAIEVVYLSDGTYNPARGVRGGLDGAASRQHKRFVDGSLSDELGPYGRISLEPGETVRSVSAAGGGYGPPHERDPHRVAKDVREGYITPTRARTTYHVILDSHGACDEHATRVRRSRAADLTRK
jgi:N-methylhydantoinase B